MLQLDAEKTYQFLNSISTELTSAEATTLWIILGVKLANTDQDKFVSALSNTLSKEYEVTGKYAPLLSTLAKTQRKVSIERLMKDDAFKQILAGEAVPNPLLMGQTIGEA